MEKLIIYMTIAVIFAIIVGVPFFLKRSRRSHSDSTHIAVLKERIQTQREEKNRLSLRNTELLETVEERGRIIAHLERELSVALSEQKMERENNAEKILLLKGAREELTNHFRLLANTILEEKTKTFSEHHTTRLGEILNPLKERLADFQKKIQENYEVEGKERHSLRNEVQKLMDMNNRLSQEASNLTNALKGDNKVQGNWGEMILERILEVSGLRRGEEYSIQESHTGKDGRRIQPDVVIHLPQERHMIIDSKISLNAYSTYINSDDEKSQSNAIKAHIASIRAHIKDLAPKEYQKIYDAKSPDFVVMFIPIEPAFMLAIAQDEKLWEEAWKNNILLVSSSTLLFVMRIVMQLWRQEQRSRNALDIAQCGAGLYEKLVGFVNDFESVGTRIEQAAKSFQSARSKLSTGRGNAIRQAEKLKSLGISTQKHFPDSYLNDSESILQEIQDT